MIPIILEERTSTYPVIGLVLASLGRIGPATCWLWASSQSGRGDTPDIEHPVLSVEVKSRSKIPGWIEDALEQAESSSRDGHTPAAVLHPDGGRYADALVVCQLSLMAGHHTFTGGLRANYQALALFCLAAPVFEYSL
ncbi:hypothetical protein BH24ACT22_BH24ACT22_13530 [soil metagenome]